MSAAGIISPTEVGCPSPSPEQTGRATRHVATLVAVCVMALTLSASAVAWGDGRGRVIATSSDTVSVSPVMDSYRGVTVWSELDQPASPTALAYRLTASVGGERVRLPVGPRQAPFDVNLGPDGNGGVVAAYSRCASGEAQRGTPYPTWARARGCDLYRYDFASGRESKIDGASTDGASEVEPSIWKDRVAFVRVYEQRKGQRGKLPYLYLRTLGSGQRSDRQPGGARSTFGGPRRLDLYGRNLSFVWQISGAKTRETSELRLVVIGSGHRLISRAQTGTDGTLYPSYTGPQGADGRLYYGFQRVRFGDRGEPTSVKTSVQFIYDISSKSRRLQSALPLTVDQATHGVSRTVGVAQTVFDPGAPSTILELDAGP